MKTPGVPVRIGLAAGVLAAALAGLVLREGAARSGGAEVLLQIDGYDPRSLLTGHFVRFQTRTESPPGVACPPLGGQGSWVALSRKGDLHMAVGEAVTREAAQQLGEVVVRGSAQCIDLSPRRVEETAGVQVAATMLDLGIDRFHADQAQAEAIETALLRRDGAPVEARAVVSVGTDGRARLKGLIIDGRRYDLDWF